MWTLCHVRIIFAWFDFSGRQSSNQLDVSINMFVCSTYLLYANLFDILLQLGND